MGSWQIEGAAYTEKDWGGEEPQGLCGHVVRGQQRVRETRERGRTWTGLCTKGHKCDNITLFWQESVASPGVPGSVPLWICHPNSAGPVALSFIALAHSSSHHPSTHPPISFINGPMRCIPIFSSTPVVLIVAAVESCGFECSWHVLHNLSHCSISF